ncbi:MAG: hypothetical protein AAF228_07500 [Pseudomonadota bacterium]
MVKILEFTPKKKRKKNSARKASHKHVQGEAEIIIFPGVRVERTEAGLLLEDLRSDEDFDPANDIDTDSVKKRCKKAKDDLIGDQKK